MRRRTQVCIISRLAIWWSLWLSSGQWVKTTSGFSSAIIFCTLSSQSLSIMVLPSICPAKTGLAFRIAQALTASFLRIAAASSWVFSFNSGFAGGQVDDGYLVPVIRQPGQGTAAARFRGRPGAPRNIRSFSFGPD